MAEVEIPTVDPNEAMEIVRDLRSKGLVQGLDFDFAYHRTQYSQDGWECIKPAHTVFWFYNENEKWASWLLLKYSDRK